MMTLLCCADRN